MQGSAGGRAGDAGAGGAAAAWVWCALGAAVCAAAGRLEPSLLEEGLSLHVAERMLAGDHLYRDVVLVTGPLPFALVAGVFSLFGPSLPAARLLVALLHGLACGALFGLSRRGGAGVWAHPAAAALACAPLLLFPLLSVAFYTTFATSLGFVAAWLAWRGLGSGAWAVAAGATVAAVALCKQSVGAALALALLAGLLLLAPPPHRLRRAGAFCAGGAGVALATLAAFAALGDLGDFVASMLTLPEGRAFGVPFINLWPPGRLSPELAPLEYSYVPEVIVTLRHGAFGAPPTAILLAQVLFLVPPVALLLLLARRLRGPLPPALWMLAAAALACGSNLVPRSDAGHLVFALPAAFALGITSVAGLAGPAGGRRGRRAAWVCAALLGGLAAWVGLRLDAIAGPPTWGPRVPVRPVSFWLRSSAVPRVIDTLRARIEPGEPIFVARAEPLLYFATGAHNPTPYTGALQVWGARAEQQDTILRALDRVRFVVMSDTDETLTIYREEMPRVQELFERHYRVLPEFTGLGWPHDWILVMERGPDRGPTLVDLSAAGSDPRPWRVDAGGGIRAAPPPVALPTRQNRRPLGLALGAGGGGADWSLRVPEDGRLQVSVGFREIAGHEQPDRLVFAVQVSRGGAFETLARERVVFREETGHGHRWKDLELDLADYAGEPVTLRLGARARRPPAAGAIAIWGGPRIAGPVPP